MGARQLSAYSMTPRFERVEHIADMIRGFTFKHGDTYKALAREWNVSYDYVRELGAEAFAKVRSELVEPEVATTSACVALQHVIEEAQREGDRNAIIQASNAWAKLAYQHKDHQRQTKMGDAGSIRQQIALVRSVLDALESQGVPDELTEGES
jgi:hypothetical protein